MMSEPAAIGVEDHPRAASAGVPTGGQAGGGRILIIGGGIAGLSCGCYLQMNGIQTEILEAGLLPGGLCTAWHRGPYVFDGCLRWLLGTNPSSAFHQIWTELGAIAGRKIISHDEVLRIEGPNGEFLSVPADLDELAREFKRVAPEDAALIDRLVSDARRCSFLEPPLENPLELMSPLEKMKTGLRYLPLLPVILRWKSLPILSYVARYRNRFLRESLLIIAGDKRMSALVLVMVLGLKSRKNTAFVSGGSWAFTQAIANRYARLGGIVRYKARVVSVTVENDHAVGVRCADGTALRTSTVVSCADGHATIFKMLNGRYVNKRILSLYQSSDLFPAILQISLGIDTTLPAEPRTVNLPLSRPIVVDDATRHERMEVEVFDSESAFCPEGKSVITVRLPTLDRILGPAQEGGSPALPGAQESHCQGCDRPSRAPVSEPGGTH